MTSFSVMNCRTIERMDGARIAGTLCIDSNHNPEFVAGPHNYGHWLLAFVYPLFNGTSKLLASGQPIDVLLSHGHSWGSRYMHTFHHKIEEIFHARCEKNAKFTSASWPPLRSNAGVDADAHPGRALCDEVVRVSVPFGTMQLDAGYFRHAHTVRARVLDRLHLGMVPRSRGMASYLATLPPTTMPRIVVILRNTSARTVVGLDKACTEPLRVWAMQRLRVNVECVSFTKNSTLAQQAAVVGSPTIGLLGVHGAAMSNVFFTPTGATFAELHPAIDARLAVRGIHLHLAHALGIAALPVWLDQSGARLFPSNPIEVRRNNRTRHLIKGQYTASMKIKPDVLVDLIRGIAQRGLQSTSGGHVGRSWSGEAWRDIVNHSHRSFRSPVDLLWL